MLHGTYGVSVNGEQLLQVAVAQRVLFSGRMEANLACQQKGGRGMGAGALLLGLLRHPATNTPVPHGSVRGQVW